MSMVDANSHPSFTEVRKPSKLENDMLDEIAKLRAHIDAYREAFDEGAKIREDMEARLTLHDLVVAQCKAKAAKAEARVTELSQQRDTARLACEEGAEIFGEFRTRITELEESNAGWQASVANLARDGLTQLNRIKELETEKKQSAEADKEAGGPGYSHEMRVLTLKWRTAEDRVAQLEAELATKRRERHETMGARSEMKRERDAALGKVAVLEAGQRGKEPKP